MCLQLRFIYHSFTSVLIIRNAAHTAHYTAHSTRQHSTKHCNQSIQTIFSFAICTFLLAVTKFIILPNPDTSYVVYTNRILTITTIFIIAMLSMRYRTVVEKRNSERLQYEKQIEEMLFITSHKVRRPLANCVGLLDVFQSDETLTKVEQNDIIEHMKNSAVELDVFTKELTVFMGNLKKQKAKIVDE